MPRIVISETRLPRCHLLTAFFFSLSLLREGKGVPDLQREIASLLPQQQQQKKGEEEKKDISKFSRLPYTDGDDPNQARKQVFTWIHTYFPQHSAPSPPPPPPPPPFPPVDNSITHQSQSGAMRSKVIIKYMSIFTTDLTRI